MLHPSEYHNTESQAYVVFHVDDDMCAGPRVELGALHSSLETVHDLKSTYVRTAQGMSM